MQAFRPWGTTRKTDLGLGLVSLPLIRHALRLALFGKSIEVCVVHVGDDGDFLSEEDFTGKAGPRGDLGIGERLGSVHTLRAAPVEQPEGRPQAFALFGYLRLLDQFIAPKALVHFALRDDVLSVPAPIEFISRGVELDRDGDRLS